jgi:GTP-binding protein
VGITEDDDAVATWLRRAGKPVLLGVNKADNNQREDDRWQFLALGLGEPHPISALHGRRTGDFLDEVVARLPSVNGERPDGDGAADDDADDARGDDRDGALGERGSAIPAVAIVGRPNVGKSTLFNRLIGDDRSVVHDQPGTTRDAIDTVVDTPDGPIRYVDTAGMRRKSRIDDPTEYYSLVRALRAVDESDIALLVIDATEGVTAQDQRLAERIDAAGCPVVVLLNKWELLDDPDDRADVLGQMARKLHFIGDALTGKGVHKLRPVLADAIERYHRRVPTREVNAVIADAQQAQPAPGGARVLYALQGASDPPTFTLFVNRELPSTYLRYLERKLRERFDLGSVPIKLRVRKRSS